MEMLPIPLSTRAASSRVLQKSGLRIKFRSDILFYKRNWLNVGTNEKWVGVGGGVRPVVMHVLILFNLAAILKKTNFPFCSL
jgi:hypothetical protein